METSWSGRSNRRGGPPLIEDLLPDFDVRERHSTVVRASPERVYAALWSVDFVSSRVIRALLAARALPAALAGALQRQRSTAHRRSRVTLTLHDVLASGFVLLAEDPPRELVLGVVGAFWRLSGGRLRIDPEAFVTAEPAGAAKAAWNFRVAELESGVSLLSTETRVKCSDAASRWRFRAYWILVRPGSGLIRRMMLRAIRAAAEA